VKPGRLECLLRRIAGEGDAMAGLFVGLAALLFLTALTIQAAGS
jgi:hypothetical protein